MAAIDSAYQYYLSTYHNSAVSRYDTHKKSQLRAVYNNIIKTNKESPLYKIKSSGDAKIFAIDIKERARSVQNVIASLSDSPDGSINMFAKKIAQSSDEDTVSAEYVSPDPSVDINEDVNFDVEVKRLATPQVNTGHYMQPDRCDLKAGTYSFDLSTPLTSYEFQYTVGAGDTNLTVLKKLEHLVNHSNVGLEASITENDSGRCALRIESRQTGLSDNEQYLFEIMPAPDQGSLKAMRTLGIDHVSGMPQNSSFLLNGTERTSLSNTFTVNNLFSLTLKKSSQDGSPARIGFKTDTDAIADNIQKLVNAYNNCIQLGHDNADPQQSRRLIADFSAAARPYYNELEAIGLSFTEDNYISVDRSLLTDAVTAEDAKDSFATLNQFKEALSTKAANASINPMYYVNKVLVVYKNPGHNLASPYISSIYSGMMLDQYC